MNHATVAIPPNDRRLSLGGVALNAHWFLRAGLASVLLFHGVGKLADVTGFASMMDLSVPVVWLVTLAEIGGGLAILIGAFGRDWLTRLGAAVNIPVLLGAIYLVHWGQWSFVASESHPLGGMEFQVVLLLIASYLVAKGNEA